MTVAEELSLLEATGASDALYDRMHPDAKAIVPREAVVGWFAEASSTVGASKAEAKKVRFVPWTWAVNGKTYPDAAEVAYTQQLADGTVVRDEVRLVKDFEGNWGWFFGRDRAFVEEQIARFADRAEEGSQDPTPGEAPLPPEPNAVFPAYTVLDLGTGNGNWSSASRINERGDVLWTWATTQDPMADLLSDDQPMLWMNGTSTDLTDLGIYFTRAINDGGTVLGGAYLPGPSPNNLLYHADSGTVTQIDPFNVGSAVDLNNAGDLIGWMYGTTAIAANGSVETVPIPKGFTRLGPVAINESEQLASTASDDFNGGVNQRAVLIADGRVTILDAAPAAESSSANDLNDLGQAVGSPGVGGMHHEYQYGRAFLYDHRTGTTTDVGTLPGYQNSVATAVNNLGQVVGYAWLPANEADPIRRAFFYDHRAGVISDLNQLIARGSGWHLVDAFDINDAGQIVGRGLIGGGMHAFVLTPQA
jgi:probable HAF family extracellular repeat protein